MIAFLRWLRDISFRLLDKVDLPLLLALLCVMLISLVVLASASGENSRLVLSQGVRLAVVGITVGLFGALAASRLLTRLLFQTEPTDITTFVTTTAALALVAVAASLVPALHAVRTDPVDALRSE